jgi:hypothetical protein
LILLEPNGPLSERARVTNVVCVLELNPESCDRILVIRNRQLIDLSLIVGSMFSAT